MSRVVLIHWNAAEAEERAQRLRRLGHEAEPLGPAGTVGLRAVREDPPDAVVIDLGRLPAQGRAVATQLRQWAATRRVPIVFVDGRREAVASARALLPDAVYGRWNGIRGALRRAIGSPGEDPVVPGTMAGYSGTPLPKKLGIRAGSKVALLGAPAGFERTLRPLPTSVRVTRRARSSTRVILLFVKSRADLRRRFSGAARAMAEGGALWIAWPKQASGVRTDLTQQAVRAFGLGAGFVDYKICAIDATWSGLCFARRGRAPAPGQRR